jgi:hypothetical protein
VPAADAAQLSVQQRQRVSLPPERPASPQQRLQQV